MKKAATSKPAPPVAPDTELAPGYRVIRLLSRGNDLDVYDAWSDDLESRCVIKTLRPDRLDRPRLVERLAAEGQMLTSFNHPHLVRGYAMLDDPRPMVVMETITGFTLEALLTRQRGRLPLASLVCLGEHLCSALQYLHRRDVLHLDLKPMNIVSEAGKAKIIDFSLAHAPGVGPAGWGTPAYMAPEQASGNSFTTASDVWALGLVLYEAATGVQPFDEPASSTTSGSATESGSATGSDPVDSSPSLPSSAGEEETNYYQLTVRAEPLRTLRRLPLTLSKSIDRCLEPDPEARPEVMELFGVLRELQPLQA